MLIRNTIVFSADSVFIGKIIYFFIYFRILGVSHRPSFKAFPHFRRFTMPSFFIWTFNAMLAYFCNIISLLSYICRTTFIRFQSVVRQEVREDEIGKNKYIKSYIQAILKRSIRLNSIGFIILGKIILRFF